MTTKTDDDAPFHPKLMCSICRMSYDWLTRTGELHFPEGSRCDMTGALELFKAIDSRVRAIRTFAGAKSDAIFFKRGKEWQTWLPGGEPSWRIGRMCPDDAEGEGP
jgi:hypothetical protein